MKLSELVNEKAISTSLKSSTKDAVIRELVSLLEKAHGLKTGREILKSVVEREATMSTGTGHGVAIPHGKAKSIESLVASCGVSSKGIEFQSADGETVKLFVLIVSPEELRGPYVQALANISRLLKEESVREQLKKSANAQEFLEVLRQAEAKYL
jgi:mannitol/fructose-specific phosphotransferase system IIA component (Ntr-type)